MRYCAQNGKLLRASILLPKLDGYTCPSCNREVELKVVSHTNTPFFSHIKRENCTHELMLKELMEVLEDTAIGIIYTLAKHSKIDVRDGVSADV